MEYIKLSDGLHFTVNKVAGFTYKMWDVGGKKMVTSDSWKEGFTKKWQVETDKGILDLSQSQLSACLVTTFDVRTQMADIANAKFQVKTNGKTGMEIRYFFNRVDDYREAPRATTMPQDERSEPDWDNIPV